MHYSQYMDMRRGCSLLLKKKKEQINTKIENEEQGTEKREKTIFKQE